LPTSVYIPLVVYTLLMFCFKGFKTSKKTACHVSLVSPNVTHHLNKIISKVLVKLLMKIEIWGLNQL